MNHPMIHRRQGIGGDCGLVHISVDALRGFAGRWCGVVSGRQVGPGVGEGCEHLRDLCQVPIGESEDGRVLAVQPPHQTAVQRQGR
ncbi:hypothetical protein ABZV75_37460, partial [Streptomyces flaveolus]|uniref:hypothetical protein n=1 Tax=Streptomyces flaveolus TaxID=67297 RepID=UPI0033A3FA26